MLLLSSFTDGEIHPNFLKYGGNLNVCEEKKLSKDFPDKNWVNLKVLEVCWFRKKKINSH